MNKIIQILRFIAVGVIILVSAIVALILFPLALKDGLVENPDAWDYETEPGEIDITYYPDDDEDNVIFGGH